MTPTTTKAIPQPPGSMLQTVNQLRKLGFLEYLRQAWQEYGDLFAVKLGNPPMVLAIHPEHVRYFNITNVANYQKLDSYATPRQYLLGDGLITSTGELWKRQRKLMAPFYTPRGIQAFAGIMIEETQALLGRWRTLAASGQEVDMSDEMAYTAAAIILKSMFTMEADDKLLDIKDAFETAIAFLSEQRRRPIKLPLWVPTPENRRFSQAFRMLTDYLNKLLDTRRQMPEEQWPDDLLSRLMLARDEDTGEAMSDKLLQDETMTVFLAGHETTARTLTYAMYALATNPPILERLQAEVDSVLAQDQVPTLDDLHDLPYTLQVIKETLRLYTPAPLYVRDAVNDDELDGYHIPAGTAVMMSPYLTHRHPEFWPEPESFDPLRWTPEAEKAQHPYAYHPFAAGQRVCIGNNFSLLESHIVLAQVIRHFVPRLREGYQPEWVMAGTLGVKGGMPMTVEARH